MITRQSVKDFPDSPGIYIFSEKGKPIYIGKSVNIKTRVLSHIAQATLSEKENKIVSLADSIECKITLNNFDAILLEAELIKKHLPKYNVIWKDDKHHLYLKINPKDTYPKLQPVRKENDGKSLYFGPFSSTKLTYWLMYELRKVAPFCTSQSLTKRGCFYSRIGLCNPCPNRIEHEKDEDEKKRLQKIYKANLRKIIRILKGSSIDIVAQYQEKLATYITEKNYEDAIIIRDKLVQLERFLMNSSYTRPYLGKETDTEGLFSEVKNFIKEHFHREIEPDYRIECYDMSNFQGAHPTGSMVVCENGELTKKKYRIFHVQRKGISDIHSMEEILLRRLKHDEWEQPTLIVLDGGKPQLRHISQVFEKENISIPLISLSKSPDRILTTKNEFRPIYLDKTSQLFKLFQVLRDESHRFAGKHHRILRDKKYKVDKLK